MLLYNIHSINNVFYIYYIYNVSWFKKATQLVEVRCSNNVTKSLLIGDKNSSIYCLHFSQNTNLYKLLNYEINFKYVTDLNKKSILG